MQITTSTSFLMFSIIFIAAVTSLDVDAKELGNNCTTTIFPNVSNILTRLVKSGRKIFNFEVHISDKRTDNLLKPVPLDYFANARYFSWIPNKSDGLKAYKYFPYDFPVYSFNLLNAYIATPSIDIDINCEKQNIQRYDVIHLIFEELKRIVFIDELQMGESGYMCFIISLLHNMEKNNPSALLAYRRLGMNREIVKNYCCELSKSENYVYEPKSICSGDIENSSFSNYANIVGAVLWAFSPLFIRFISKAEIPSYPRQFNLAQLPRDEFLFRIEYTLPYKSEWINEKHSIYNFSHFLSWLFFFHHSTFFASRIRRFILILSSLSVILLDILMHYIFLRDTLKILFQDRIPLGYRSLILGIPESYENTDGFFGGPFFGIISYILLSFIVFILPSRVSETIAYSTLHQRSTCTFLIQNIDLLKNYGNLNVSILKNYDLLYAIMKANISTALNPNFWCLIIHTWIKRLQRIWFYYYKSNICSQFLLLWFFIAITILFAVFSICELLLCLIYYGFPIVYLIFTLPLSYFKVYILPQYARNIYSFTIIAVILTLLFLPGLTLWVLYSSYVFLTSFEIILSYIFSLTIAILAKPDAVGDVWFVAMFFVYGAAVLNATLKQYHTILLKTIKLTKTVRPNLVQSRYGEEFINAKLFKVIVNNHYPLRYEIGKSVIKLFLIVSFFFACSNIVSRKDLDLSTTTKIALLLMTSMIPKFLSIINTNFHFDTFQSSEIIETINVFVE